MAVSAMQLALLSAHTDTLSVVLPRVIFILLLAAAVWNFCRTLWKRFGRDGAHRNTGLSHDHAAARLWRVFREVMLQTRVIRDRPVAGVLHALVMWGFFAFLWVGAEHLWLGFRGLEGAQPPHGWYPAFAALWAVAVLAGISGLAFRRFVLRPAALGKLSGTSAAVAGLIALLMLTYLAGWGWLPAGSAEWKANWWLHTLAFLAILVVIPTSKHLHLLLAPVAIFFRSTHTSALRPLRDDDDLGMVRFRDLDWKNVLQINSCVECGRCTDACPAHLVGRSLNPKEVVLGMQRGWFGGGDTIAGRTEEVANGSAWVRDDDLFACFTCGACEQACPAGVEHTGRTIVDLRRGLVSEGRVSNQKVAQFFADMERQPRNPWGISRQTRDKFLESEGFPVFDGSQEWLLWTGCCLSYEAHGHEVARAMARIFDHAGVSWGVLDHEACCGEPARRLGNEFLYQELAGEVTAIFRKKGVRKVISTCPHCTAVFDVDYRQMPEYAAMEIEVVHHAEFLAALLPRLALSPEQRTLAYHDPCYLARGRGVIREPRAVLEACGATVHEMRHARERGLCCGGGGAQIFIEDGKNTRGGRVNERRFAEVLETGADSMAVACPYCPIMLRDAAATAGRADFAILDVAQVVAQRLEKEGTGSCTRQKSFAHTA